MKRKLMIIIGLTLMGLLVYSSGYAQMNQQQLRNRFQYEYETTEQVINQAQNAIGESKTEKGQALLQLAIQLQNQARVMGQNQYYNQGIETSLKAREQARAAMAVAVQADENENLVVRQLERTDNIIAQFQNQISSDSAPMVRTMFENARENQRKAWEFYRNRSLRAALKLSRQAEKSVEGMGERIKSEQGDLTRLRTQTKQLEQKMEQVHSMVRDCDNEEASGLFIKAQNNFNESQQHASKGEIKQAENKLQLTHRLLNQIGEMCGDQEALQNKIQQMKQEMEHVAEAIQNSGDADAIQLMLSARNHLQEAEKLCAVGNSENCAANIKAAQMNFQKAKKLAGL
ncbi:MAG: hypothetical protein AB1746_06980 [Candidatus Zixiibacteriota bacterium]